MRKKMIGRVGTDPCTQLRRELITQKRMLEEAESRVPRDEHEVQQIKEAIESTQKKLKASGCV